MDQLLKEKTLNFISSIAYLAVFIISIIMLNRSGFRIDDVSLLDMILIVLATYRVSRMIVYEKIFSLIRYFISKNSDRVIFASVNNLITCPWCTAVWMALILFDIYFLVPFGNYFILIMSLSALATPLILLSNMLNLKNDILKQKRDSKL